MLNENPDNWIVGKEYESKKDGELYFPIFSKTDPELRLRIKSPYGRKGDVMWMRETWNKRSEKAQLMGFDKYYHKAGWENCTDGGWKPSIHMPREACRFEAVIKDERLERLWDITEEDAVAEGLQPIAGETEAWPDYMHNNGSYATARGSYLSLIQKLNKLPDGANPWVWVVEYVNPLKKYEECNTL
jgi:hypothetical protein